MAKWQDLPTELILLILQNLDSTRDPNSVSLVSRQSRALIEPQLYSDVTIVPNIPHFREDDTIEDDFSGEQRTRSFRRFVRTIVGRPSLGSHVKKLELASWERRVNYDYDYTDDVVRCHLKIPDEDHEEALHAAGARFDAMRDDLRTIAIAAVEKGLPNGLVLAAGTRGLAIVLLHYVPDLRELSITSRDEIETVALTCLGYFDGGVPAGLLSISTLNMVYDVYDDTEVCPHIPSVRRID